MFLGGADSVETLHISHDASHDPLLHAEKMLIGTPPSGGISESWTNGTLR